MSESIVNHRYREPSPAFPPGLDATQGPNARNPGYVPVGFYERTYANDEEGWTYVTHKRKYKSKRHDRRVAKAAASN